MIKYIYDAWGNSKILDSEVIDEVDMGDINPFRYRGYYYDGDTGLYCLGTRYYDPETGRFISQDSIDYADPETINGLNLYAYCGNNPVMYADPNGNSWKSFWNSLGGKILGTILVVAAVVLVSVLTAGVGSGVASALGGGAIATILGGAVGGAISGAVIGAGMSIASQGISDGYGNINWKQVGNDTLISAGIGAVTGGLFGGLKYFAGANKIANGLSGLSRAQQKFSQASFVLQFTPMEITGGVMSTERIAAQLSYNFASVTLSRAQNVYNVLSFIFKQTYMIAQFGFKQLFGSTMRG